MGSIRANKPAPTLRRYELIKAFNPVFFERVCCIQSRPCNVTRCRRRPARDQGIAAINFRAQRGFGGSASNGLIRNSQVDPGGASAGPSSWRPPATLRSTPNSDVGTHPVFARVYGEAIE
jgi:hypothetical protein